MLTTTCTVLLEGLADPAHREVWSEFEARWEYAARAGTTTPWWTGGERASLAGAANFADAANDRSQPHWKTAEPGIEIDDGHALHAPVGSFRANPFGLHDVHGNVDEWCRERFSPYGPSYHSAGLDRDQAFDDQRIMRGGDYSHPSGAIRSAYRISYAEGARLGVIGVRPVRELER